MADSFEALRGANPRTSAAHAQSLEAVARDVRARLAPVHGAPASRRRLGGLLAVGAAAAAAAVAVVLSTSGSHGQTAAAAVAQAATLTAASAEQSGTAVVRITHDGNPWAGSTVSWNGENLSLTSGLPQRAGRPGSEMRVVDG